MIKKKSAVRFPLAALLLLFLGPVPGLAQDETAVTFTIAPTVFLVEREGRLCQTAEVKWPVGRAGEFTATAEAEGRKEETRFTAAKETAAVQVLLPACEKESCRTRVEIKDAQGAMVGSATIDLPYQRRWKIYLSPFSHIDVGFTNSQRKILAQNLDNLRVALNLIQKTRDYPAESRFKFFTEVSWPLSVFMYSDATTPEEKKTMAEALRTGQIEVGGFLISHANKFMPSEALFRSPETALKIGRDFGTVIRTGCLNDLMDFSAIVKPQHAAGIPYFLGGPNTNRYVTPPLFYLQPPVGDERVLAWLTPNLNGYGENFDFAMRADLPLADSSLQEIAKRLGPYLQSLEQAGSPPASVRDHFDFFGATWPYPFDIYLLPFYPAHAVDNGPQDETASELARIWNQRFASPRLIVATPSEFFAEAEKRYASQIPTLRGELPGFWGEQVFFAFAQVDPGKESGQRMFERSVIWYEESSALKLIRGESGPDLSTHIAHGFELVALNNDHNPGPVPFGHTNYTKDDVAEWKQTRQDWKAEIMKTGQELSRPSLPGTLHREAGGHPAPEPATAKEVGETVILENHYYRIKVDKRSGGISSLYDKELGRELAGRDGQYLLGQYVVVARGEDAGLRGNLFTRPGFKSVKIEIVEPGPKPAAVKISGEPAKNGDALKVLAAFIKKALGVRIPTFVIKAIEPVLKVKIGPVAEVEVVISLNDSDRAVFFIERFKVDREQAIDHTIAFPFNTPQDLPLIVEGPYSPYRFDAVPPWGKGDLIPAARMKDAKFPGINDFSFQFEWIQGLPPDAVFRSYVLARGDGFGIAFSSRDSGVILPGPLNKDPWRGPFGGGFYHQVLGWTVYSSALLGTPRAGEFTFYSALTSFPAKDESEAKTTAASFGHWFTSAGKASELAQSSSSAVRVVSARPISDRLLLFRLYETSGAGAEVKITVPALSSLASATRARFDGMPIAHGELKVSGNSFSIKLGPGEVANVRIEVR